MRGKRARGCLRFQEETKGLLVDGSCTSWKKEGTDLILKKKKRVEGKGENCGHRNGT